MNALPAMSLHVVRDAVLVGPHGGENGATVATQEEYDELNAAFKEKTKLIEELKAELQKLESAETIESAEVKSIKDRLREHETALNALQAQLAQLSIRQAQGFCVIS